MDCRFPKRIRDKIYQQVQIYDDEYRKQIGILNYFSNMSSLKDYDHEKKLAEQPSIIAEYCQIKGEYNP